MSDGDHLELWGEVIKVEPAGLFRVSLDESSSVILARLSGKMRKMKINVLCGDHVLVKVSPYDLTHGFVVRRAVKER